MIELGIMKLRFILLPSGRMFIMANAPMYTIPIQPQTKALARLYCWFSWYVNNNYSITYIPVIGGGLVPADSVPSGSFSCFKGSRNIVASLGVGL